MHRTLTFLLPALAVAAPALAQPVVPVQTVVPEGAILDVTAIGRISRVPDIATVTAGVVTQAPTAAAALAENARRMDGVIAALKGAGIATRDVSTNNVSLSPQYRYGENQPPAITGYQATNSVNVKFRDVAQSGRALDALVKAGANQISGPTLALDKPEAALDEARSDAIARARARAELYARAAGLRVERIVSISENGEDAGGNPPPMPYRARMVAAAPQADTQVLAGETDVTATVVVRFLLK